MTNVPISDVSGHSHVTKCGVHEDTRAGLLLRGFSWLESEERTLILAGLALAAFAVLFLPTATRLDRTRSVAVPATGLPDPSDEPRSVGH